MNAVKAVLAAVHCAARTAVVLAALAAERSEYTTSLVYAGVAIGGHLVVRIASAVLRAHLEVNVSVEVVDRVLRSDLFRAPLRLQHDVLVGGLYEATRRDAVILPALAGDGAAAVIISATALARGEAYRLFAFLAGLALSMSIIVLVRRSFGRASTRAWAHRQAHTQRVLDGLEGAEELVAARAVESFESRLEAGLRTLRRASWSVGLESLIIGRLPIAAGIAMALALTAVAGKTLPQGATQWAVLAAMLPPFGGLVSGVASLVEIHGATETVRAALARQHRATGRTRPGKGVLPLEITAVSVRYRTEALSRVSVVVREGCIAIAGPNGSGKSTLLRLLVGLVTPESGRVVVGGVDAIDLDWEAARARIAYLPQASYLPVGGTIRDAFELLGVSDPTAQRRALDSLGLGSVLTHKRAEDPLSAPLDQLSVGERQRVAIARVVAREADVYLFDEPDANLDGAGTKQLCQVIRELAHSATVVIAAHTPEVIAVADRVVELAGGIIVRDERCRTDTISERLRVGSRS